MTDDAGQDLQVSRATSMIGFCIDEVERLGWPHIRDLTVRETWEWCRSLPGFDSGSPRTRGGRALAALSYRIKQSIDENTPMILVWLFVGIEALFGAGTEGLRARSSKSTNSTRQTVWFSQAAERHVRVSVTLRTWGSGPSARAFQLFRFDA